jgi:uncharacterized protein YbjQ (UPF0145 family)
MIKSVVGGVLFSGGDLPGENLGQVVAQIARQNALPSDIKRKLAQKAKDLGANAVSNFEIAQVGHHWVFSASLLKWDTESVFAVGQAIKIPKELMSEALKP